MLSSTASAFADAYGAMRSNSMDDAHFRTEHLFSHSEVISRLSSDQVDQRLGALHAVLVQSSLGNDVSDLFPHIVKHLGSRESKTKRLVYVYLLQHLGSAANHVVLALNGVFKDLGDPSPVTRSHALKALCGFLTSRRELVVDKALGAFNRASLDSSPLVRRVVAGSLSVLYEAYVDLDQEKVVEIYERLISDGSPGVAAIALGSGVHVRLSKVGAGDSPKTGPCSQGASRSQFTNMSRAQFTNMLQSLPQLEHALAIRIVPGLRRFIMSNFALPEESKSELYAAFRDTVKKLSQYSLSASFATQFHQLSGIDVLSNSRLGSRLIGSSSSASHELQLLLSKFGFGSPIFSFDSILERIHKMDSNACDSMNRTLPGSLHSLLMLPLDKHEADECVGEYIAYVIQMAKSGSLVGLGSSSVGHHASLDRAVLLLASKSRKLAVRRAALMTAVEKREVEKTEAVVAPEKNVSSPERDSKEMRVAGFLCAALITDPAGWIKDQLCLGKALDFISRQNTHILLLTTNLLSALADQLSDCEEPILSGLKSPVIHQLVAFAAQVYLCHLVNSKPESSATGSKYRPDGIPPEVSSQLLNPVQDCLYSLLLVLGRVSLSEPSSLYCRLLSSSLKATPSEIHERILEQVLESSERLVPKPEFTKPPSQGLTAKVGTNIPEVVVGTASIDVNEQLPIDPLQASSKPSLNQNGGTSQLANPKLKVDDFFNAGSDDEHDDSIREGRSEDSTRRADTPFVMDLSSAGWLQAAQK